MERRLRDAVERCVAMPSPLTRCAVPEALTRCDPSIFAPLERCLASSEHEERAQEGLPTNGNRNGNPVANGPAADADVFTWWQQPPSLKDVYLLQALSRAQQKGLVRPTAAALVLSDVKWAPDRRSFRWPRGRSEDVGRRDAWRGAGTH